MKNIILSCEHGGYDIPSNYQKYFTRFQDKLRTHISWDRGALELAKYFQVKLNSDLHYSTISRLLIEQNRSITEPELFSSISKDFTDVQKNKLKEEIYIPYVNTIDGLIQKQITAHKLTYHLSIHSFTPILNGVRRDAEIGILFDPKNPTELSYANAWMHSIQTKMPNWRIKFNYPYLGIDDGLTTHFRNKYPTTYAGLELEVNNQLFEDYSLERLGKLLLPPKI
ncbi:MAG: putative N-formylglutamate amidohydrolase [Marivirga sp.]|jgi:predicted N-formylglutamate amidohydrolase